MRAETEHKAEKGVVRISLVAEKIALPETLRVTQLEITEDFFFHPEEKLTALEAALQGTTFAQSRTQESYASLEQKIAAFYQREGIVSPGLRPHDFAQAIIKAMTSLEEG